MNKGDLIDFVAKKTGQTKTMVAEVVETFFSAVTDGLKKDGEVRASGLGNFRVVQTKAREGRNPRTGAKIRIAASKRVKFSASKELKEAVGGKKK